MSEEEETVNKYRQSMEIDMDGDVLEDDSNYRDDIKKKSFKKPIRGAVLIYLMLLGLIFLGIYMLYSRLSTTTVIQAQLKVPPLEVNTYYSKTTYLCDRNQYFHFAGSCKPCPENCLYCSERLGQCVRCKNGFTNNKGKCEPGQVDSKTLSGLFRIETLEFAYVILNGGDANRVIYVFVDDLYDQLEYFSQVKNTSFVIVNDYFLLSNKEFMIDFKEQFMGFVENQILKVKNISRIAIADHDKSNQLMSLLNEFNSQEFKHVVYIDPEDFVKDARNILPHIYPTEDLPVDQLVSLPRLDKCLVLSSDNDKLPKSLRNLCKGEVVPEELKRQYKCEPKEKDYMKQIIEFASNH